MIRRKSYAFLFAVSVAAVFPSRGQAPQGLPGYQQAATPDAKHTPTGKEPTARERRNAETAYLSGAKALEHEDYQTAEKEFDTAVSLVPGDEQYSAARE